MNAARIQRAFLLTPMPVLAITATGSDVTIAWATNGLNFTLLSSPEVAATNWTAVTNTPVVANGSNLVTISASDANGFYRLMFAQ